MRYFKASLLCAVAIAAWAASAAWASFLGWWMDPVTEAGDTEGFYAWAVGEIEQNSRGSSALVLIENGAVVRRHFRGPDDAVDEDTLFPTASMSKWIAGLAVMSLAEEGRVDLDAPVSTYLTRWRLPDSEFDLDAVTVRRLLSHTAGLTDELGFGDYAADEMPPSLEDSLRAPRASRGEAVVSVGREPGAGFLYSGGGYLILELLVEEVSGMRYEDYVGEAVLTPLGMSRSTFAYLGEQDNATPSYDVDGSIAPTYRYASKAATAFASTAADLVRLVHALLPGSDRGPLSQESLAAMREPNAFVVGAGIWGLGTMLYVRAPDGAYVFGHDGANDPAINATARIHPTSSDAIIVLVTGQPALASNIGAEWVLWQTGYPDFLSTDRALRSSVTPIIVGTVVILLLTVVLMRRGRRAGATT